MTEQMNSPDFTASRYDFILALIPASFLLATLIGHVLQISFMGTSVIAGVFALAVLVDGLFIHPPVTKEEIAE